MVACTVLYGIGVLCVCAQSTPGLPGFEVMVVKPANPAVTGEHWDTDGTLTTMQNITLLELIRNAYMLKTVGQVLEAPEWIRTEKFDLKAKVSESEYRREEELHGAEGNKAYGLLLQSLLAERFGLRVRSETRSLPVFAMVLDGKAATLHAKPTGTSTEGRHASGQNGHMAAAGITMDDLAEMLSGRFEVEQRVVVNRTDVEGRYDFTLNWVPDRGNGVAADATEPGLLDALRQQLGVRLRKENGDVPVVLVEAAKHPDFD